MLRYLVANKKLSLDSSLIHSAENGQLEVVRYLVSLGADIHIEEEEALRWSA